MTNAAILTVLGGRQAFKRKIGSDEDLRSVTRLGLPVETLSQLAEKLNVERKTLAKVVGISDRTLSRRLANDSLLSIEESDRTMRLARVVAMTVDTLGTTEKAARWLQKPNRAMGGQVPLELLDTDAGVREVETILNRIEYGLYS